MDTKYRVSVSVAKEREREREREYDDSPRIMLCWFVCVNFIISCWRCSFDEEKISSLGRRRLVWSVDSVGIDILARRNIR
jgi:hypothetical protein